MKYLFTLLFIIAPFMAISLAITVLYYNNCIKWLNKPKTKDRRILERHTTAFIIDN